MSTPREVCTFHLDGHLFGVDVVDVQEIISPQQMTRVPLAPPAVAGLLNVRGQLVTAIDLRRRLDLPPRPPEAAPMNIVVRTGDGAVSFLVDRIGDVCPVDADCFEPVPDTLTGPARELVTGVQKLPDQLLLILNAAKAAALFNEPATPQT